MQEQARTDAANESTQQDAAQGVAPTAQQNAAAPRRASTAQQGAAAQRRASTAQQKAAAQGGSGPGQPDHDHDRDCLRICGARELPTADHDLELDHIDLEAALHGPSTTRGRRSYNWNRSNEVTRTFDSIARLLNQTVPPDREEIDAQRINAAKKAGR